MSSNYTRNPNQDPARYWMPITITEEKDLSGLRVVAIYAAGAGNIALEDAVGRVAVVPFAAGQERMWAAKKIRNAAAGTNASGIFVLYNE
jgi:hypothetical protein